MHVWYSTVYFYIFVPKLPKPFSQFIIIIILDDGTPRLSKDKPRIDSCIENKLSNILLSKTRAFLLEKIEQMNIFIDLILVSVSMSTHV